MQFLRADLDLARTFLELAEGTDHPERRRKILNDINKVILTVRHFEERIEDADEWRQIHEKTDQLEAARNLVK